jgi:hypothetical protein
MHYLDLSFLLAYDDPRQRQFRFFSRKNCTQRVHLIQTTHQKGRRRRHSHFSDCKNSGGKASLVILILIHARAKTFDFIDGPSSSLDSRPWGRLIQFTTVHKLQDFSDHYTWLTTSFAFAGNGFSIGSGVGDSRPLGLCGMAICATCIILCDSRAS